MATLTETSIITRKIIRYSIYAIILVVVLRFAIRTSILIYRRIVPPPKPQPTVAFGKLPKIPFPEKNLPDKLNFTLDLIEGNLPALPELIEVFPIIEYQPNIKALDDAKAKARALGFNPAGRLLIETIPNVYIFAKDRVPSALTMNIVTNVFSISYRIEEDPEAISGLPPRPEVALSRLKGLLSSASLLTPEIADGPASFEFLKIRGGKFVKEVALTESDLIKVNLFKKGLGEKNIPSVTPKMPEANIWAIFSGKGGGEIIAAEYHNFPIDINRKATYPLKTAEQAWKELTEGKGFIANLGENNPENIVIKKVYLAYYDPGVYTKYYQPVVVFEGDNDFYAFVPAVEEKYYGEKE